MENKHILLVDTIHTMDNLELLNGLYFLTKRLISLGLRCKYFTLSNIIVDDGPIGHRQFQIKDRRTLRISHIALEYLDHPDFIDDLDTYFDRLGRDLYRLGKSEIYHNLITITMRYIENNH